MTTPADEAARSLVDLGEIDLVGRLLDSLAKRDPHLRSLLMHAAVPRVADAGLLEHLVPSLASDPTAFSRAYGLLLDLPFVKEVPGEAFTIHDDVRDPLMELWQQSSSDDGSVATARARVLEVWEARYQQAVRAEAALDLVGPLIRETSPRRYRSAQKAISRMVDHALVEAVSAAVALSPETGRDRLESWLNQRAGRRDHVQRDLLVRAFADAVTAIADPAERSRMQAWASYFHARVAADLEDWAAATAWLEGAEPLTRTDATFALWVASLRERVLMGQYRLAQARESAEALIALNAEGHADPWNEHVAYSQRAEALDMLWCSEEAAAAYQDAVNSAVRVGNRSGEINARLAQARVTNDQELAAEQVLRALAASRLDPPRRSVSVWCARSALAVLGWRSPRLMALLSQQARQLARGDGPQAAIDLLGDQAEVLDRVGLPEQALRKLDEAIEAAADVAPSRLLDLTVTRAGALDDVGRPRESAEVALAVLSDPEVSSDLWLRARVLVNAAVSLLEVSEAERAITLANSARALFDQMGHERAAAYTAVIRAEAHRRLGRIGDAARELALVDRRLPPSYASMVHLSRSRLADASGDRAAAADHALRALDGVRGLGGYPGHMLTILGETVKQLAAVARYDEAERLLMTVAGVAGQATTFAGWEATELETSAAAHAAEAVRIWTAGIGPARLRLRSAREHFAEALRLDPQEGWYHLESGLVEAAADESAEADRHLDLALSRLDDGPTRQALVRIRADGLSGT